MLGGGMTSVTQYRGTGANRVDDAYMGEAALAAERHRRVGGYAAPIANFILITSLLWTKTVYLDIPPPGDESGTRRRLCSTHCKLHPYHKFIMD